MKWLSSNILNIVVLIILLWVVFKPKDQTLSDYKVKQLQQENADLQHVNDSLTKLVSVPLPTVNDGIDSVLLNQNKIILNELRKKNAARIDSAGSDELLRLFAGYQ